MIMKCDFSEDGIHYNHELRVLRKKPLRPSIRDMQLWASNQKIQVTFYKSKGCCWAGFTSYNHAFEFQMVFG